MSGYIGSQPADSFLSISSQQISGNGGATYTLNLSVTSPEDVAVFVNNVRQNPNTYSVSNNQITLGGTIANSDSCYVVFLGKTLATVNPPSGSVGLTQLSATGTKNNTTFLRGDNTFATPSGGVNTPSFHAYLSSDQSISNSSQTLINYDTEIFDTSGAYNTSTKKFQPQTAGKYVVYAQMTPNSGDDYDVFELQLYKNEVSTTGTQALCRGRNEDSDTKYINRIVEFNGSSDFVYVYTFQTSGAGRNIRGTRYDTFFGAYKLIE